MRGLPCGEDGVLLEVFSTVHAVAVHEALTGLPGVAESVPAARTVLVVFADGADRTALLRRARQVADEPPPHAHAAALELPVVYDGPDLADAAAEVGMRPDDVAARHSDAEYVVGFCGFAPGFAYLTGLPPELHVPRLPTPRTLVPAGSVAIAGEFTGVYPRASPGGWRLIGHTDAELWNPTRQPPALLVPGTVVRFRPA